MILIITTVQNNNNNVMTKNLPRAGRGNSSLWSLISFINCFWQFELKRANCEWARSHLDLSCCKYSRNQPRNPESNRTLQLYWGDAVVLGINPHIKSNMISPVELYFLCHKDLWEGQTIERCLKSIWEGDFLSKILTSKPD